MRIYYIARKADTIGPEVVRYKMVFKRDLYPSARQQHCRTAWHICDGCGQLAHKFSNLPLAMWALGEPVGHCRDLGRRGFWREVCWPTQAMLDGAFALGGDDAVNVLLKGAGAGPRPKGGTHAQP